MSSKNVYQKLGHRISEEVQLLAEEKWILETLTKIKNQRNCLQIERLHLESLKAKIKGIKRDIPETITKLDDEPVASTSAVNLMQNATTFKSPHEVNDKILTVNEVTCNEEELNLLVTDPVFGTQFSNTDFNAMDDEEEEESDDDMFIDMNMLMNGMKK